MLPERAANGSLPSDGRRIADMQKLIVLAWNYVFNHEVSPLRHIPDISVRHMILQILGWMWAVSFAVAIGSYTYLPASLIGHAALIAADSLSSSNAFNCSDDIIVNARSSVS